MKITSKKKANILEVTVALPPSNNLVKVDSYDVLNLVKEDHDIVGYENKLTLRSNDKTKSVGIFEFKLKTKNTTRTKKEEK